MLSLTCLLITVLMGAVEAFSNSTNVPTLYVETADGNLNYVHQEKGNKIPATIMAVDGDGNLLYTGICDLSGRGNSTWNCPKRPYNLKFRQPTDILCANDSAATWCLLANYLDNSQIRNALCYYMAREMDIPYTSNVYFVSLYVNGEYLGLYNLATKQKYLADVDDKVMAVFEKIIQNIYLKTVFDGISSHDFIFRTIYGDTDSILKAVERFETVLYNESSTYSDLSRYADIESIARKNLVDLVTGNVDLMISQYYMLDSECRIVAINAWDYDITYGSQPDFDFAYNQIQSNHPWYNALFRYKEYREELSRLLRQNESMLTEKSILLEDSLYNNLKYELSENAKKWQVVNSGREQIDTFRTKRITFLKEYIENPDKFFRLRFVSSGVRELTLCFSCGDTVTIDMLPNGLLSKQDESFEGWFTIDGTSIADIGAMYHDMEFYEQYRESMNDPYDNETLRYFLPLAVVIFLLFLLWFVVKGIIIPIKEARK